MPIGITEEHEHLRGAVRRFVDDRIAPAVVREALEAKTQARPVFWDALAEPGWIGLHVDEAHGGSGAGLVEQAVVIEELGRACAPGSYVPTAIVAALLQADGGVQECDALLPRIASGELTAAVALDGATLATGGAAADLVVCAVDGAWYALDAATANAHEVKSIDLTRRLARIDPVAVPERKLANLTDERVRLLAATLFAAEAVGLAQWCVDTAAEYAKVRVQFGRPIGQFQGVKHRCAEMLARVELARAAVWDAASAADDLMDAGAPLAIAAAAALAFDAAFVNAKDCVQTLGGIGFTWEHDAHIYLRRAMTLQQLTGTPDDWRIRAAQAAMHGARRRLNVDVSGSPEVDEFRAELRALLAETKELSPNEQRNRLAEAGYVTPGWPAPWGRDAKAIELLVIEEEFRAAKVVRPNIGVGGWALPNLIVHGTEAQRARWILPTLRGEIGWCQLFSEPGAGSDLASLSTRATRVEGGWLLNGQKVWTSMAKEADWGICLARTNPEAAKHDGISCFMVDMKTPGIDIRPLRELTGQAMFNEVFFDDVFVPEDCLVGREHDGWRAARTTLANERVYMGSSNTIGGGVVGVLKAIEAQGRAHDRLALNEAGGLVATGHALSALGFRLTLAALAGADPSGSEAAVRKLLGVQHDQHVQEVGMLVTGVEAAAAEGDASAWSASFLFNRCLTIAGGTSDVQRNVIAERLLGLPRDP
jgi:alkylation response protein AidB-like acyl-CoA dehydrogenase